MEIPIYQVDAFASGVFEGNPAAVCLPSVPLDAALMQRIAQENHLSETAFLSPTDADQGDFEIRWFTPTVEVDLCGHATLASAWVVFHRMPEARSQVDFHSRSGRLIARNDGDRIVLDFPAQIAQPVEAPAGLEAALGATPKEVRDADYWLCVFESEAEVLALAPDFRALAALGKPIIASARGKEVDFVSRFFAPSHGIDEDPVTGSAHCILTPYWSERLSKKILSARQLSARGGFVRCDDHGPRIHLSGRAVLYLEGVIRV